MSQIVAQSSRTEHAWLVLLGEYARQLGLTQALNAVPLQQKVRTHRPQTKVIEFLVAILAGLPHLEDISRDGHPLDQDEAVALAWQQAAWADYSGVSRTLQGLSMSEAQAIGAVLDRFSQPFIDEAVVAAMRTQGRLVYDGDLTGRPVSDTSTTYPGVAYGHMDDAVHLGYQAAVVSLESPSDQRLWLSVQPHPGNTVSCTQVAAMVAAAEQRTCVRPLRRTELLNQRLLTVTEQRLKAEGRLKQRQTALAKAQVRRQHRLHELAAAQVTVTQLAEAPRPRQRPERPYSQLAQAQARVATKQRQADRQQHVVAEAQRRVSRQRELVATVCSLEQTLQLRLQHFLAENATNLAPVQAVFRLDAGFGTWDNIALLIEMGYEVYTKPHQHQDCDPGKYGCTANTFWLPVGSNAEMVAWPDQQLKACPYPLDVAVERFYTGKTIRHSILVHFGQDCVTEDLPAWFAIYNQRQTIEAGIKEGKAVFQMHHLKVRSAPALWLQEQFAAFAANFVRWADRWLDSDCRQWPDDWATHVIASLKTQVQVAAQTPAFVDWLADGCLLTFTAESPFAGYSIQSGTCAFQLCLPLFKPCDFDPFSPNWGLIAQKLR
jgi:hypothetical protein